MSFSYSVTVYRRNLQAEFQVGGQGYTWMDKVRLEMHTRAKAAAAGFTRSGDILNSHRSYQRGINQWACRFEIINESDHAKYKHQGTYGPIVPTDSPFLWVPARPMGTWRIARASVNGQIGQPWLDNACTSVALGYGAVPYG